MNEFDYEYGIKHIRFPAELWRGPWTRERALEWLRSAEEDGIVHGTFYLVRRPVSHNWEVAE